MRWKPERKRSTRNFKNEGLDRKLWNVDHKVHVCKQGMRQAIYVMRPKTFRRYREDLDLIL